jgi:hypothetical protein
MSESLIVYIATELAAEEHRRGRSYGWVGHCKACDAEAVRLMQAECEHAGERVDTTGLGDAMRQVLCQRCGLVFEEER